MEKTEKRELLIAFQRYWNLEGHDIRYILGIDIDKFLSTFPNEGEKVDKRIKMCSAAIHGFLDGYELDNSSDVIEKSEVINNLKTILTLLK